MKFICNHCKNSKEHKTHKTISENRNILIENKKIYALTLKKEINSNIEISKRYENKFPSSKFIEASSWREIILRKYEQFYEKYQSYLNKFKVPDDSKIKFMNISMNLKMILLKNLKIFLKIDKEWKIKYIILLKKPKHL